MYDGKPSNITVSVVVCRKKTTCYELLMVEIREKG